jgi:hypothetical protein
VAFFGYFFAQMAGRHFLINKGRKNIFTSQNVLATRARRHEKKKLHFIAPLWQTGLQFFHREE